jgi:hypothetical protein
MTATLAPLTPVVVQVPWGAETIQPTADEAMVYSALSALAAGSPIPPVPASYSYATPWGTMTGQYRAITTQLVAAIAAIAAAG